METSIYCATVTRDNVSKYYIGTTKNPDSLTKYPHLRFKCNPILYNDILNGVITFDILEVTDDANRINYWIDKYESWNHEKGYNVTFKDPWYRSDEYKQTRKEIRWPKSLTKKEPKVETEEERQVRLQRMRDYSKSWKQRKKETGSGKNPKVDIKPTGDNWTELVPGLWISREGKVFNKTVAINASGYQVICLSKNEIKALHSKFPSIHFYPVFQVHRLVALTYIRNHYNLPVVNHIDGNKMNNSVDNLEWCSHQYNTMHAVSKKLIYAPNHEKMLEGWVKQPQKMLL